MRYPFGLDGTPNLLNLLDEAPNDGWTKWGVGVVIPALMTCYASSVLATGTVTMLSRRAPLTLTGTDAVWAVVGMLALAAYLHCHGFWSNSPRLAGVANFAKGLCGVVLLIAIAANFLRTLG